LNDTNSENQQVAKSLYPPKKDKEMKMKGGVMLARKCDLAEISDDDICFGVHADLELARYLLLPLTFSGV
jgi:hypothetical protein